MAEDKRKKRHYKSTKTGGLSPQPDIATVGKHEGRALQPSAEAKSPGEMYGPYRGPFSNRVNDPKYHTRGEPVKSIMNMDRFPSPTPGPRRTPLYDSSAPRRSFQQRMDTAAEKVGQAAQDRPQFPMSPATTGQMQTIGDRLRPLAAQSPRSAREFEAIKGGFGALKQKAMDVWNNMSLKPQPYSPYGATPPQPWDSPLAQTKTQTRPQNEPITVKGPFPGQGEDPGSAGIQERVNAAVGLEPAAGTPGSNEQMPGEALRQLHSKMDEQLPAERGRPEFINTPGRHQLTPYTPTEQEKEAPIHVLKGNQESWWDPKTEERFPTLGEAFRGEQSDLTTARATKAAEREFELEKIGVEAEAKKKWVDVERPEILGEGAVDYGRLFHEGTGESMPLQSGGAGGNQIAAQVAQVKTREDWDALLAGKTAEEKQAMVNMLTKEQVDAVSKKRK